MNKQWQFCALSCALLCATGTTLAQQSEEDELALSYGDKSSVTIATGSQQPLSRAPAVASVITAEDIKAMGALDLDQALESVPGLHVSKSSTALTPIYGFRGIATNYNPQVLMLVNGIPVNEAFLGNRGQATRAMSLENVARIEVIRGPGSALYGSEAFSGVINIITKTADDIDGTTYGVQAGSFNTRAAWIQHGGELGPFESAFYLRAGRTDGYDSRVEQDVQSSLDAAFGTNASRAPGPLNAFHKSLNAGADLAYDNWRLRLGYTRQSTGMGAGLADNLDPDSRLPESKLNADLTYQAMNWLPNWNLSAAVGYLDVREKPSKSAYRLFPAGVTFPWGTFPEGVIGNPSHSERHAHASVTATYTGLDGHRIRVGSGYRLEDMYQISETKNFDVVIIPGVAPVIVPLPAMTDATGNPDLIFMQPHKRHVSYVFAQDEWRIAQDWTLTAGVRHDRYSDFGNTTNPRVAFVWDAAYNLTVKLLHGRAFRAPSFVEEYAINNPVALGNPALKPETIRTDELAFSWQPQPDVHTNLNLFRYRMRDIIQFAPNSDPTTGKTAQNTGDQNGHGMEFEASWDVSRALRLTGNFSLQHSKDGATGLDAGLMPRHRLYARADWRFAPLWQLGGTVNRVADRTRQPGDARSEIPDYTTVDLNLSREKFVGGWEVRATVKNLLDRNAREPSLAPGNIPFDIPLPGRAFYLQFQHEL
jgi:iron complex outermembrane receptor protein